MVPLNSMVLYDRFRDDENDHDVDVFYVLKCVDGLISFDAEGGDCCST